MSRPNWKTPLTLCSMFLVLVLFLNPLLACAQPSPGFLRLTEGSTVTLRAAREVSSADAKDGDPVAFTVMSPVTLNGVTVIATAAQATGHVVKARRAGMFGRSGELQVAIDSVKAVDGTDIKLRGNPDGKGGNQALLAIGGALLLTVFAVFIQGRNAVLQPDKDIVAYVAEDRDFQVLTPPPPVAFQAPVQAAPAGSAFPSAQVATMPTGPQVATVPNTPQVAAVSTAPQVATLPAGPQVATVAGAPQEAPVSQAGGPLSTPPAAAAPALPPPEVRKLMVCQKVTAKGYPDGEREKVSARVPSLSLWWEVQPADLARKFEVRWHHGQEGLYATSTHLQAGGKATGWVTVLAPRPQTFSPGPWVVELYLDGQFLGGREFEVVL